MLLEQVKCTVNPFIPDRAESYKGFVFPSQKLAITTLIGIGGVRLVLSGSSLSLQLFFFCRVSPAVSTLSCSWVSEDVAKKYFAKHYEHCTFGREVLALPISVAMVSTVVIPMAILAAVCSRSTQKLTQANTTIK